MTRTDPLAAGLVSEADVESRVLAAYLRVLGIQPSEIRAQRSFSLRLGRSMHQVDGPSVTLFADDFVLRELFPLDLGALRRLVQIELVYRSYETAFQRARLEEARREQRARGGSAKYVISILGWTKAEASAMRQRAAQEVDGGSLVPKGAGLPDDLQSLIEAVDSLLQQGIALAHPLLPEADRRFDGSAAGGNNFDDGYTDQQLAQLIEHSDRLRSLLRVAPRLLQATCWRVPFGHRYNGQFSANVTYAGVEGGGGE
jgi:hypothetical protein